MQSPACKFTTFFSISQELNSIQNRSIDAILDRSSMKIKTPRYTLKHLKAEFPDEDTCLAFIFKARHGHHPCPKCKMYNTYYRLKKRKCYSCSRCGHHIYPLAHTIFHKSATPLTTWFHALFLFSCSKNGVSAMELMRQVGVTYKCAWRMCRQIRLLMNSGTEMLEGVVEVDEAYMAQFGHTFYPKKVKKREVIIVGAVEKGTGKVQAVVAPNVKKATLFAFIRSRIKPGSTLHTDEWIGYWGISAYGYDHKKVYHKVRQYVKDGITTNTIEGFWGQLKRSINGTYHYVSRKYLGLYVDEFSWRYSNRNSPSPLFHLLLQRI